MSVLSVENQHAEVSTTTSTFVIITIEDIFHSPGGVPRTVATGSPIYSQLDVDYFWLGF